MSRFTGRTVPALAVALALGFLLLAWRSAQQRRALDESLSAAVARGAALRAALDRAARPPVAAPPAEGRARPPAAAAAPAEAKAPSKPTRPRSLRDLARDHPQLWNDFIQSKRVEFGRLYLPFFLRQTLAPPLQERFKDILAAELARGSDLAAAAAELGLEYSDPSIVALRRQAEDQRRRELAELLGDQGFREYEQFERTRRVRGFVDGLAPQLAELAPLSARQADQLTLALAESTAGFAQGGEADPGTVDWPAVDRRAGEILTPAQFAVWQRGVAHNTFSGSRRWLELEEAYRRAVQRRQAGPGEDAAAVARKSPD